MLALATYTAITSLKKNRKKSLRSQELIGERLSVLISSMNKEHLLLINLLAAKGPLEFQAIQSMQSATLEGLYDNNEVPLDRKGEDDLYGVPEPSEDFDDSKWAVSDGASVPFIY
jgi:hypothetical protein